MVRARIMAKLLHSFEFLKFGGQDVREKQIKMLIDFFLWLVVGFLANQSRIFKMIARA